MQPNQTETEIIDLLKAQTEQLDLELESGQLRNLLTYLHLLKSFNEKVNLVADADPALVARTHLADCLTVARSMKALSQNVSRVGESVRLVDIGSGAGFPGLIVAMALPGTRVLLIESIGKKARFLSQASEQLGLADRIEVSVERAEELSHSRLRESFDFASARAVGHLGMVAELALPFLKKGGHFLCQKSAGQAELEIEEMRTSLAGLAGGEPLVQVPPVQTGKNQHVIVDIKKIGKSASQYPRSWSQIVKRWKA